MVAERIGVPVIGAGRLQVVKLGRLKMGFVEPKAVSATYYCMGGQAFALSTLW